MQVLKIHGDIYLGLYMRYLLTDYESKGATTEVLDLQVQTEKVTANIQATHNNKKCLLVANNGNGIA